MKPLFALSLISLALLGACTSLPAPPQQVVLATPNLPLATPYPSDNKSTDSPTLPAPPPSVAGSRWQDFYQDDKLKALINLGLQNNKNLAQATLAIQKAAAQYNITKSQNTPNAVSRGSYTYGGNQHHQSDNFQVGLAMPSYEIDFWGRVDALKDQALHNYLATSAAKDSTQISLIANIASTYTNISYAKAQLILAQGTQKSREHSLYIAQRRFEAGIDSKAPSLQATASLENARLAVMTAQTALLRYENALQLLIGMPIPSELSPDPAVSSLVSETLISAGLPSELLYYRPDVAAAEYQLKAAGASIEAARAAFFPSISLSGNLGLASTDLSKLLTGNALGWSFGPSVNLPIFDGGARRANLDMAMIEQKQRLAAYEGAIQTAFREVNDVLAGRSNLDDRLQAGYRLQKTYQQSYDIAYATFRTGLSNYLDVLDAERSLFAIQQQILDLERQKVLSQIELYQALGGGATLDAPQITDADQQAAAMTPAQLATELPTSTAKP